MCPLKCVAANKYHQERAAPNPSSAPLHNECSLHCCGYTQQTALSPSYFSIAFFSTSSDNEDAIKLKLTSPLPHPCSSSRFSTTPLQERAPLSLSGLKTLPANSGRFEDQATQSGEHPTSSPMWTAGESWMPGQHRGLSRSPSSAAAQQLPLLATHCTDKSILSFPLKRTNISPA